MPNINATILNKFSNIRMIELDNEAFKRSSSVYLVDRCVPMIPKRLSNGICSLKSGSDKLCYSVIVDRRDISYIS